MIGGADKVMRLQTLPAGPRIERMARGFTLIELMVVVAIVGILVAIAVPSYAESVRKSRRGQAKADLMELVQLAERFHTVNRSYAGFWASVPATHRVSPRTGNGAAVYALDRDGGADTAVNTFVLTATPVAGSAQANDRCGVLSINQLGQKTHSAGDDNQCQFGVTP